MLQLDLLIGRRVYDRRGSKVGRTSEIVIRRTGEEYAVEGLITGVEGWADRLNIASAVRVLGGPVAKRALGRRHSFARWNQIARIGDDRIDLLVDKDGLSDAQDALRAER